MLLLTGARRGNVQAMRWEDVDLKAKLWRIPSQHSKNREPMTEVIRRHRDAIGGINPDHVPQRLLATALKDSILLDIEAIDGSQITLPVSAADTFPSTNEDHGGVKLTATLSVLYQTITSITLTDPV